MSARADLAEAETEASLADVDEAQAHVRYREASERAEKRVDGASD